MHIFYSPFLFFAILNFLYILIISLRRTEPACELMCAEPTPACLNNTCCRLEHPLLNSITTNNNKSNSSNKDLYNEDDDRNNNSVKSNRQDWDIVILNKQNSTAVNKESQSNSSPGAVAVMVVAKQIFIEDYLSSASVC
jgi:hypothetical protein